jgi:hypothetical protein
MVNNAIERSIIIVSTARTGYPIIIKSIDNTRDTMPLPICKARNHAGG